MGFILMMFVYLLLLLSCLLKTSNILVKAEILESTTNSSYSFDQYVSDFGKFYKKESEEYQRREKIFRQNWNIMEQHNNKKKSYYKLGINQFMDMESRELPTGYDKSIHTKQQWLVRNNNKLRHDFHLLEMDEQQRQLRGHESSSSSNNDHRQHLHKLHLLLGLDDVDDLSKLPEFVDWRTEGVVTPVKSQGRCGSCWAFSSIAVLESHVALQTKKLFTMSTQELVSCTPNPNNCGGDGGCTGATAELAFDYVTHNGILMEDQFGYQSYYGNTVPCSIQHRKHSKPPPLSPLVSFESASQQRRITRGNLNEKNDDDHHHYHNNDTYIEGAVAAIKGYVVLPTNSYKYLMYAVAKIGPVAVSVACTDWHLYQSGIFEEGDDEEESGKKNRTASATDVNHLVVLVGYGTDAETGKDYWLVRNSWGPTWGEDGYIRLKRTDPSTLVHPEDDCGIDWTPADGVACTKDDGGHNVIPPAVPVCGTSGILFNSVVPYGGFLL